MSKRDISQSFLALAVFVILGFFANSGLDLMNEPSDIAFWGGCLILFITAVLGSFFVKDVYDYVMKEESKSE